MRFEAKRNRNAKMMVVDLRFTRTAATADMFLQISAGADIAFLGGIINYAIENQASPKSTWRSPTPRSSCRKDSSSLNELADAQGWLLALPDPGACAGAPPTAPSHSIQTASSTSIRTTASAVNRRIVNSRVRMSCMFNEAAPRASRP